MVKMILCCDMIGNIGKNNDLLFKMKEDMKFFKFVTTLKCQIVKCEDENTGRYRVKYQDAEMTAYSLNKGLLYKDNTEVYVLVPDNNLDEQKIILYAVSSEVTFSKLNGKVDDEGYLVISLG